MANYSYNYRKLKKFLQEKGAWEKFKERYYYSHSDSLKEFDQKLNFEGFYEYAISRAFIWNGFEYEYWRELSYEWFDKVRESKYRS